MPPLDPGFVEPEVCNTEDKEYKYKKKVPSGPLGYVPTNLQQHIKPSLGSVTLIFIIPQTLFRTHLLIGLQSCERLLPLPWT